MPQKFCFVKIEFAKLYAFCSYVPTCLHACVPTCICTSNYYVRTDLSAFYYCVPTCLKLLTAYVSSFFTCHYIFFVPTYVVSYIISCLRVLIFHLLTSLQPVTKYIKGDFYSSYCGFLLDYLTFHSIQNPKTNSCLYNSYSNPTLWGFGVKWCVHRDNNLRIH